MNPPKVRNKCVYIRVRTHIHQLQLWLCAGVSLSATCALPCGIQSQDPCIQLCVWTQPVPRAQDKWPPLPSRKVPRETDPLLANSPDDLLFPPGRKLESPRGNRVLFFRWDTRQGTEVGKGIGRRMELLAENTAGSSCHVWANIETVGWETEDLPKRKAAIQFCVVLALV